MFTKLMRIFSPGKNDGYFPTLERGSANVFKMAEDLEALCKQHGEVERNHSLSLIEENAHKSILITHEITIELSENFLTLIDRNDVHEMAKILESIADHIKTIAQRFCLYNIKELSAEETKLIETLKTCCGEIKLGVVDLEEPNTLIKLKGHCVNINSLENEAGKIIGQKLKTLLSKSENQVEQIKHVEFINVIELAIEKCEELANCFENLIVKLN